MLSQASQQLVDDHLALDELLGKLKSALHAGDVEASHTGLDLFWARLAVHIRAEHLQLFPAVIDRLARTTQGPALSEARSTIKNLRADHDFFMHELAKAIGTLRTLLREAHVTIDKGIKLVRNAIIEIEMRLIVHNELEENKIYSWLATIFTEQEQTELANLINIELAYRPPRFSLDAWMTQP